jgi:hypothetical protein
MHFSFVAVVLAVSGVATGQSRDPRSPKPFIPTQDDATIATSIESTESVATINSSGSGLHQDEDADWKVNHDLVKPEPFVVPGSGDMNKKLADVAVVGGDGKGGNKVKNPNNTKSSSPPIKRAKGYKATKRAVNADLAAQQRVANTNKKQQDTAVLLAGVTGLIAVVAAIVAVHKRRSKPKALSIDDVIVGLLKQNTVPPYKTSNLANEYGPQSFV